MTRATILYPLVAGLALAATCSAGARYTIEDIGPVSWVFAINNRGEVLANDSNYPVQPFLYLDGRIKPLPQPASGQFGARTLNNRGDFVGYVNPVYPIPTT
jgi:hypothetical protein